VIKRHRKLIEGMIRRAGLDDRLSVAQTSGGHIAVQRPDGTTVCVQPSTPSDGRWQADLRSKLRREGGQL
jgi:hypothetical protein